MISSLLVSVSTSGRFVSVSGRLVRAESRIKQGFFALEALLRLHFFQSGFKSAFLPILERNQGRQERNRERRQYIIQYTAE